MNAIDPAAVAAALGRARREGRRYRAVCPSCGKHTFTIGSSEDGLLLVTCWSGCAQQELVARLKAMALWPSRNGHERPDSHTHPPLPRPGGRASTATGEDGARWAEWWEGYTGVPWPKWQHWGARAIAGGVAFVWASLPGVEKRRLKDGPKGLWTGSPCPPLWPEVPDRLPDEVWLAEGESDCGVLRHAGLEAYGCTKGAAGLPGEVVAALRRRGCRRVVIAFDADDAGRKGAEAVAQAAQAAGLEAATVVWDVLLRPELGEKDVRDIYRRLGTPERLRAVLTAAVREWGRGEPPAPDEGTSQRPVINRWDVGTFVDLAEVPESGPPQWLVPELVPAGHVTLLYGDGGVSKSVLALALALATATGGTWLGRPVIVPHPQGSPGAGPVLFVDFELAAELQAHRLRQLAAGCGVDIPAVPGGAIRYLPAGAAGLNFYKAIEVVTAAIAALSAEGRRPPLVIWDSFGASAPGDMTANDAMTNAMARLRTLGVTVLVIDHQAAPAAGVDYADKRPFGSTYKWNLARSVLQVELVGSHEGEAAVLVRHKKSNFGPLSADTALRLSFGSRIVIAVGDVTEPDFIGRAKADVRIVAALAAGADTAEGLSEALGLPLRTVQNTLTALVRRGRVRVAGKDGRAQRYEVADGPSGAAPGPSLNPGLEAAAGDDDGERPNIPSINNGTLGRSSGRVAAGPAGREERDGEGEGGSDDGFEEFEL